MKISKLDRIFKNLFNELKLLQIEIKRRENIIYTEGFGDGAKETNVEWIETTAEKIEAIKKAVSSLG